ncbi:MAG: ABC transporter permease subunit [Leptospiraceae bacterium]|nr:ABC transporter permease subunit [Leptospiraceae bacterium]
MKGSLQRIYWVYLKELASFFGSSLPPLSIGILAFCCGFVSVILASTDRATYEQVTIAIFYIFYILTLGAGVFLSMSAFVNERRQGTLELLYSLPISDLELVIGKFLLNFSILGALLFLMQGVYIFWIAETPMYMTATGLIGLWLVAMYATSVGIFASSFTESHLISLLIATGILVFVDIGGYLAGLLPAPAREIFSYMHALDQFNPFTRGILPLQGTLFFGGLTVLFLFFTVRVLESRRWRGN